MTDSREGRSDLCCCGCYRWEHYRHANGTSAQRGAMTCGVSPRCRQFSLTGVPVRQAAMTACTGLTASWCPLHGDCACPRHGDADNPMTSEVMRGEVIEGRMDDDLCPLHAYSSEHPLVPQSGRTAP